MRRTPTPDASVRAASPSPTPLPSVAIPTAKPPAPTPVPDLTAGLSAYLRFYNTERLHLSLGYRTPVSVYTGQGLIETPGLAPAFAHLIFRYKWSLQRR